MNIKKPMYFISGASGVGKTSIIPFLKSLLPTNVEVHDFDEGGVPAGADHLWRIKRTREWIILAQKRLLSGVTIVISGFSNPDEIEMLETDFSDLHIQTILLDGEEAIIEQRLRSRNNNVDTLADLERVVGSADAFIENNTRFIPILREICKKHNCPVIDTTHKNSPEVAEEVIKHIM